jgi:hypothetical protein
MQNWTSRETNAIIGAVGARGNPKGIDMTISFIATPILENALMKIMVYFTSRDNGWSPDQQGNSMTPCFSSFLTARFCMPDAHGCSQ